RRAEGRGAGVLRGAARWVRGRPRAGRAPEGRGGRGAGQAAPAEGGALRARPAANQEREDPAPPRPIGLPGSAGRRRLGPREPGGAGGDGRASGLPRLPSLLPHLALLWLGGFDLRVTLLAVPPLIPAIHRDLGLDEKGVSILTGLPVLLLAIAAIPGSLLIA